MARTLVDVTFAVEHSDDVTDEELQSLISALSGSIVRKTGNMVQDKHWIHSYLITEPAGLIALDPEDIWLRKPPC